MVYVTHDQVEAMTLGDRVAVMRLGVLQQVASPQELYDHPSNLFVAGFIGSPSMNFMAGTLEDGKLRTGLGDMALTARQRQALEAAGMGREVIVGIRPENFEDASMLPADLKPHGLEFNATIDVIESLGSDKFVYFTEDLGQAKNVAELEELARDAGRADTGGAAETVVARLDPASRITEGENARLWADVRKVHVFDTATGRNITLGDVDSAAGPAGSAAPVGSAAAAGSAASVGSAAPASQAGPAGTAEADARGAAATAEADAGGSVATAEADAKGAAGTAEADAAAGQAPTTADPTSGADPR